MSPAADIHPTHLRTEYLSNPLGIDTSNPRLSWELEPESSSARGLSQTAWQIVAATDSSRLEPGRADLWDSGEIATHATAQLEYAGRPLASRQRCFWSVRVRDQRGQWSAWSEPARWTMGLLRAEDWSANWIGSAEIEAAPVGDAPLENAAPDPWLRRTFVLDREPLRATAFVASVGYHKLFVNGRAASDAVLEPAVTDNSKRARYESYEISNLLRPGTNVIGLWLGTGWSLFPKFATPDKPRAPIVIAQFDFDLPGGTSQRVVTDGAWRSHASPNQLLGAWNFRNFGGERFDARKEIDWCAPGLDASNWGHARVVRPHLVLSSDCLEPNRLVTELKPVGIRETEPGVYRFDMGRNFSGFTRLQVRGKPGQRIGIEFSEQPLEAMTHRLHDDYVVGLTGRGWFESRFNYGVGRWITVTGLQQKPSPSQLKAWVARTDYDRASAFECSNPLFNRIYETALWTFENLSLGGYSVDCPHRERMGYGGDAHATTFTALNNFSMGAFYTKWSQDWRDVQGIGPTNVGSLPYTAPTYWGGGGPAWSGYCVHLPWEIYCRYGDTRILSENFETIRRWLEYLETKSSGNLLRRWGGEWDFLGDWLWPGARGVNGDMRETLFFNNCYWVYALQTAAGIAETLGRTNESSALRSRADQVRAAIHDEFYVPSDNSYVNDDQAYLAMALYTEVVPAQLRKAVWRRLERRILEVDKGHIHAGITGGAFLFRALMEAHRDDLIYRMVDRRDYPGWGNMLDKGATTFWESWEDDPKLSKLHSSYLYVGAWFIEGVLGIQADPAAAGFKHFTIRPEIVDKPDLSFARGYYDSIRGRIWVDWKRTPDSFQLNTRIPPNTSALVYLPAADDDEVLEGGREPNVGRGVRLMRRGQGHAVLELGSGEFRLSSRRRR